MSKETSEVLNSPKVVSRPDKVLLRLQSNVGIPVPIQVGNDEVELKIWFPCPVLPESLNASKEPVSDKRHGISQLTVGYEDICTFHL